MSGDRTDEARQRAEGKLDELKGRGKQAAGALTGDQELKSRGEADETAGKAKGFVADAKAKIRDLFRR